LLRRRLIFTQEYIFIHALSFLTKDVWPVLGKTVALAFHAESPLSIVVWYRTENRRRDDACTDETGTRRRGGREWWRIYVMKRSRPGGPERETRVRTFLRRSRWRDACQDGENKERREQESLSFLTCSFGVRPVLELRRAELTAPEIWSNVHALRRIMRMKRNACARLPPTIICQNVPRLWFPRGMASSELHDSETPHVRIFEMGLPRALRKPITNLSEKRHRSLCSRNHQKIILAFC